LTRDSVAAAKPGLDELAVSFATDVGKVRRNNEDFVSTARVADAAGERFSLWLVADGVGGGPQGEVASRLAVETVAGHLAEARWSDPAQAIADAFRLANRRVHEITGTGASSTTLVSALVREVDGTVWVANVGDSRAYLISGQSARVVTADHSVVAAEVAAGHLTTDQARTAPGRNVLTRTIGSETEVGVDVYGPRKLAAGERLVLCTDGVHGMIDDEAIGRLGSSPLAAAASQLVAAALQAGGKDNATALVGGYADPEPAAGSTAAGGEHPNRAGRGTILLAIALVAAVAAVTALAAAVTGVVRL
jgi:PPM family protein phosphatase